MFWKSLGLRSILFHSWTSYDSSNSICQFPYPRQLLARVTTTSTNYCKVPYILTFLDSILVSNQNSFLIYPRQLLARVIFAMSIL